MTTPFSRRLFLGGAASIVGLPLFESLAVAKGAVLPPAPLRLLCYYVPCGIVMKGWTPSKTGSKYDLPPILAPLVDPSIGRDLKKDTLVLTGLANMPGDQKPGDHAGGTGAFLTCRSVRKSETDIYNGISMDQVLAEKIGSQTPLPSLQLGIAGGGSTGGCDSGFSCAYARNISWANATTPLPKLTSPALAFDLLFAGHDPGASAAEVAKRKAYRLSVLDNVLDEAQRLAGQLGATDVKKLDEYLAGVRDLELKIEQEDDGVACDTSAFDPDFVDEHQHIEVMNDLMVLALQCQATSIISFMIANAASRRSHDFIGVPGAHHQLSHHAGDAATIANLQKINIWEMEHFVSLLHKMQLVQEGERTLLDNSLVYFSSEIEDGNSHAHHNMPVLLAGSAGGKINSGRHVRLSGKPPMANLFISMLSALGAEVPSFGDDGTGPLDGLQ